jgi:DNA-directed RNA polymerase sigma subunit (sigma70/sigma32)
MNKTYKLIYTNDEQIKLLRDYRDNNSERAFQLLYEDYEGLFKTHVKKYPFKKLNKEEMLSVCKETFIKSVQTFNPDHETGNMTLEHFVNLNIKRGLQKSLANAHKFPDVTLLEYELLNKINIVWDQLIQEAGANEEVGLEQVAEHLEMPLEQIEKLLRIVKLVERQTVSLDYEVNDDLQFGDTIADKNVHNVYTMTNADSFKEKKPELVKIMSKSQSSTISLIHGDDEMASIIFEKLLIENPALRAEAIQSYTEFPQDEILPSLKEELEKFFEDSVTHCKKTMPYILKKALGLI